MCLSKVSETDKWRLVQPERLRRLRLWASPVRMFEVAEEGCRRCPPQRLDPRMSSEKSPRAMLLRACLGVIIRLLHDMNIRCSKVKAP